MRAKVVVALIVVVWVVAAGAWASSPAMAQGRVVYPAMGNIDLEQGTIEMWMTLQFEPSDYLGMHRQWMFFELRQDDENYFPLTWRVHVDRTGPYARHRADDTLFGARHHHMPEARRGDRIHVAYCWTTEASWWIVNGRSTPPSALSRWHSMRMTEELNLVIGGRHYRQRGDESFIIEQLRISSIPRTAEEVGFHADGDMRPDAWTLLLDDFQHISEGADERWTQSRIMMRRGRQTGGRIEAPARIETTEHGAGLRLGE